MKIMLSEQFAMWLLMLSVLSILRMETVVAAVEEKGEEMTRTDKPFQFMWGVASAAYQYEGAVTEAGKVDSIWDTFVRIPGKIANGDVPLVADDSFHKYIDDIQLVRRMGINSFRLSIAWTRIITEGGEPNTEGIAHYNAIFDALVAASLEPVVTLYHWDLPQILEDRYNGWLDGDRIAADFSFFADVCFSNFGDRVKKWITINEPWTIANAGYVVGNFAPGRCSDRQKCDRGNSSEEGYIAAHNMLNAHAKVVEVYRRSYQSQQNGVIGITLNHDWAEPLSVKSTADVAAANTRNEFAIGWFADPLFFGDYPKSMRVNVGERLPVFTSSEKDLLVDSFDFIGLNHYSSKYFSASSEEVELASAMADGSMDNSANDLLTPSTSTSTDVEAVNNTFVAVPTAGWAADQHNFESKYDLNSHLIGEQADSIWLNVVPWGFYKMLSYFNNRYTRVIKDDTTLGTIRKSPIVIITENGCDVPGESRMEMRAVLNDTFRVNYYADYLAQMEKAIEDGVRIGGYFAWSLLDNFEWADGFEKRFGLHYVNFSTPELIRQPKASAAWYSTYARDHSSTFIGYLPLSVGEMSEPLMLDESGSVLGSSSSSSSRGDDTGVYSSSNFSWSERWSHYFTSMFRSKLDAASYGGNVFVIL